MSILEEIQQERARQDLKWGPEHDDQHNLVDWSRLIRNRCSSTLTSDTRPLIRKRLIQTAALTVAAIEALDRKWTS